MPGHSVLIAHPSPDLYGSDRVMLSTVEALVQRGWRVVVTVPNSGPLVAAVEERGARVVFCATPVLRKEAMRPRGLVRLMVATLRGIRPSLRMLRTDRPDVVYVSTLTVPLWFVLARMIRRKSLCHVHEAESSLRSSVRRALAVPLMLSSRVIANSDFTRSVLVSDLPRLGGRSPVVRNPVSAPRAVTPARETLDGTVRLVYVGRLSARKGPQIALAAVEELVQRGIDARLDLVGAVVPGCESFESELRSLADRAGVGHRVKFVGFVPDVWPAIAAGDIVVLPSQSDESFGNAAIEAVLSERPVIVSAVGGFLEAVAGFESAIAVPTCDAAAIADAVATIAADWSRYRSAAKRDAARAAERHAPERYGEILDAILTELAPAARR